MICLFCYFSATVDYCCEICEFLVVIRNKVKIVCNLRKLLAVLIIPMSYFLVNMFILLNSGL
jgi:hypothetical protein